MYKIGDKLLCIKSSYYNNGHDVIMNNIYTIIDIYIGIDGVYYKIDDGAQPFGENSLFSKRFILDVKYQRKQKLEKLCLNQEIE
jgi:hypothetical protein